MLKKNVNLIIIEILLIIKTFLIQYDGKYTIHHTWETGSHWMGSIKKICRKCNIMKAEVPWGYKGDYIPGYNLYINKTNTEPPF